LEADRYVVRVATIDDFLMVAKFMDDDNKAELDIGDGQGPFAAAAETWEKRSRAWALYAAKGNVGAILAVWGFVPGEVDGEKVDVGFLFTTPEGRKAPIAAFRFAKRWLEGKPRRVILGGVHVGHPTGARFFALLGFKVYPPTPVPPFGELFHRVEYGGR
jgi:hypothetical protein